MPITRILQQPDAGSLNAAYRPVIFRVEATATGGTKQPPFVICDVYLNEMYYRSFSRTAPESIGENSTIYSFDVSEALREFLAPDLVVLTNTDVLSAPHMSAKFYCKFRASDIDSNGFTVEEGEKPVQSTRFTEAQPGGGFLSNAFFVINSALQHRDNQNLAIHLSAFKEGIWSESAYPLTHRKTYHFCNDSSDHFPFIYTGPCTNIYLRLHYRLRGEQSWQNQQSTFAPCETIDFTVSVIGQKVFVHLEETMPTGHQAQYVYKKHFAPHWSEPVYTTKQDFSFIVSEPGNFELRIIRFCSCCTGSTPITQNFVIAENAQSENLAWRGLNPFCIQAPLPGDIWVRLQLRNPQTETYYYPNNTFYYQKTTEHKSELYALFYSDPNALTPLNVVQEGLRLFVKKHNEISGTTENRTDESYLLFEINANGTEALLGDVVTQLWTTSYNIEENGSIGNPTGERNEVLSYSTYPTPKLIGGNTGAQGFANLEQYNTLSGMLTGQVKENTEDDPDYISPTPNEAACPSGAPYTIAALGYGLEVAKVEFRNAGGSIYATAIGDTGSGGHVYMLYVPKEQTTYITIKARTLDSGNTSGTVKVNVMLDDYSNQVFVVPNNIETQLPGAFKAIRAVNISNY